MTFPASDLNGWAGQLDDDDEREDTMTTIRNPMKVALVDQVEQLLELNETAILERLDAVKMDVTRTGKSELMISVKADANAARRYFVLKVVEPA